MKKKGIAVLALCCAVAVSNPVFAYINRGTVTIEADKKEISIHEGETYELPVVLTPDKDEQMEGCGMSDCPEKCGPNCLSKNNNCTCDSTTYETYYADVKIKNSNGDVAEASYKDGAVFIKGLGEGDTVLKLGARLREYTGSSIEIAVHVTGKNNDSQTEADQKEITETLPVPEKVDVTTYNEGEDRQYVNLCFAFDRKTEGIVSEDFTGTLAGEILDQENLSVESDGENITVIIRVTAIKDGTLELEYTGENLTPFILHAVISPGMNMDIISQDKEKSEVVMKVIEPYHIRGIGRVLLIENGKVVPAEDDLKNDFTGIHGHDFLNMTCEEIAEKIAYGLSEAHPDDYAFVSNGETVTVKKIDAEEPTELLLQIQESAEIELKQQQYSVVVGGSL